MRILDRYVLRNFLEPFILCFAAFIGILLIFDLNDNLSDFIQGKASFKQIGAYYLHQLPSFTLLSLPLGLLLALLYCLSKMSRSNEIISMLGAGRSVLRILMPLFVCGMVATGIAMWLNYEAAPQSEGMRKADIEAIRDGSRSKKKAERIADAESLLAVDRMTNRLWFVRKLRLNKLRLDNVPISQLDDVHITQLDARGEPVTRWLARGALYNPRESKWVLAYGRKVTYDPEGNITGIEDWSDEKKETAETSSRSMVGWGETPWRLASSVLEADHLSVPKLLEYLQYNSDFPPQKLAPFYTNLHYRWALPVTCLSVVFIAAPLGIVFSRRAVLASVASSIFIFLIYLFLMFLFLALGKGGHVSPVVAGWVPNACMFLVGCYLLWLRATNRDLPSLFRK